MVNCLLKNEEKFYRNDGYLKPTKLILRLDYKHDKAQNMTMCRTKIMNSIWHTTLIIIEIDNSDKTGDYFDWFRNKTEKKSFRKKDIE